MEQIKSYRPDTREYYKPLPEWMKAILDASSLVAILAFIFIVVCIFN